MSAAREAAEPPSRPKPLAFLYEVRPLPMVATLLAAVLGSLLAGGVPVPELPWYLLAVAGALYAGHAVDSLVDYHVRGEPKFVYMGIFEDSGGLLSAGELAGAAAVGALVWLGAILAVAAPGETLFLVGVAGLGIALAYSPLMDRNPVTVSLAYPTGTTLALVGGFLVAGGALDRRLVAVAAPVLLYLAGGKIVSDLIDEEMDRAMGKRTSVVVLGSERGRRFGVLVCVLGLAVALAAVVAGWLPRFGVAGLAFAAGTLAWSRRMPPHRATLTIVAGGYGFLASVIAPLLLAG